VRESKEDNMADYPTHRDEENEFADMILLPAIVIGIAAFFMLGRGS
jgi:hypothetical protein